MAKRRAAGEGSVFRRQDGVWVGKISAGIEEKSGKRIRTTVYGRTQSEVVKKLHDLNDRRKRGAKPAINRETLAAYLSRWLEHEIKLNRSGKTYQEYELTVRLHITPFIGTTKLSRLTGEQLARWQATLSREKRSAHARKRSVKVLRSALNRAMKLQLITVNPCLQIESPRVISKEVCPLEPSQCNALISQCTEHRIGDLITVAAMTGLRRGELFALEWSDIDLDNGILQVRKTLEELGGELKVKEPKTRAGHRSISLGAMGVNALRSRYQKAFNEGLLPPFCSIVFPNRMGGYLLGSNFARYVWYPIRKAAGIPETFVFHDLRHTQASLMLAAGVDLKVIQKRLGHQDFSTTANTYSHLLRNSQAEAAQKVESLLTHASAKQPVQPPEKLEGTNHGYSDGEILTESACHQ
jgi:integrase